MSLIPTKKKEKAEVDINPKLLLLYGAPKVGKTQVLSDPIMSDHLLIIDSENGTSQIHGTYISHVENYFSIRNLVQEVKQIEPDKNQFSFCAIDTIDRIVEAFERQVCFENQQKHIGDMGYGAGYGEVRDRVNNLIRLLKSKFKYIILISHLARGQYASETAKIVAPGSIDVSGKKLKASLIADADGIGYVYRNTEENCLNVSFKADDDEIEVGSRKAHLAGKDFKFDWRSIYPGFKF